ncbi:RNA polymerase II-associated protein 1 isoform X2 [Myripristis murdjan]|uniref:RNA polymerase II associated protein 1 n=2 Tax=Myripristis murdjan TaxID=586833 RepID=A0A667YFM4_9TELE|nr:RNA polymerase II-associated protein 1 isoform X2 [Myripristis murdjan]XP_029900758.1 RNA polymerase II-associated protein 1 isoform X2 [Myripristis murdjan]XP_029900759.1 RNA polymerase II-associated protein 1 isoform X2 [Myripristis murdjan]
MLRRPKPTDSEADLLREQELFLNSGASSKVNVVRRPDKRRGEAGGGGGGGGENSGEHGGTQRDVVTIADLPDQLPTLTPAPPKKSRFKANSVRFEEEDPEERLDRQDTHISAVLSRIIERDTSSTPVSLPPFTGTAFPKVLRLSEADGQVPLPAGKRSIFARQIAAQRLKEGKTLLHCAPKAETKGQSLPAETSMDTDQPLATTCDRPSAASGPWLVSGQGLGGPDSPAETMRIHRENEAKLQAMSESEIREEQKKLLSQLDPRLVEFVRSRKAQSVPPSTTPSKYPEDKRDQEECLPKNVDNESDSSSAAGLHQKPLEVEMEGVEEDEQPPPPPLTEKELPVKPQKEWVHMDKLEPEKLEWTRDLPAPRRKGTKKAMQARFDFAGTLIPPTEDLPTHLGLHHHGEEPELAGYSLQELFLLSRSQVIQQRSLALSTIASVLAKARAGEYTSVLRGNMTSTLLDAGLLFLLRFALDDSVEGVMSAAVHALRALLVSPEDEECMDSTFSWFRGLASFPLLPSSQEEEDEDNEGLEENMKETVKEKEERKTDYDVARLDVVKGLLKMKLLPRLRYILEVVRPAPRVVQDILEVLTRIARHSSSSATQVLDCPRLMETVMSEFLPTSWTMQSLPLPQSVYGLPLASAMKLLRVIATSGRHACARLLNSLGARERLSRLLSVEPSELLLEPAEALRITTEAYRLWAVAAGYGQACNLYIDLYPTLLEVLLSVHRALAPSDPLLPLQLQRVLAQLSFLTQVTHTAGCHQELQAGVVSSQGSECPPPPPVSWGHVTGLQASLLGHLKGLVKGLDNPVEKERNIALIPSYLVYLEAYYHQLSRQNCFKPVETLQELELLTSEVLLPLLSHNAVQSLMKNLKSFSIVCTVQSGRLGPEITASLPGLASAGWRDRPNLAALHSPFPLLIGLGLLMDTLTGIHKGLSSKFSGLLLSEPVTGYLRSCSQAVPTLSHTSAWLLRHEHHLLFLLLRLAHRLVPHEPKVAKHTSLYHQVALVLLPWLLPSSEYLAHELLSTIVFSKEFISEGHSGGPEAIELSELKLYEDTHHHTAPSFQTVGALLREACVQLPSIRGCFLTHLAHLEASVLVSRDAYLGRNPWINSQLLPELTGPTLPSDWPFLPLVSLYERMGVSNGGGLQVEELPQGALQAVTHCLQWLLLLEVWREDALKVVLPVAKLARLSCVFLCSSDLFLERPVQKLSWGLLRLLTRPSRLDSLDLDVPPPGLASFQDLYSALLAQYEAVSFGDRLFGCWVLLPLQRRYSSTLRLAVFGEHVGMLRSLGVTLEQLPVPLERFTSPPEDSLPLLRLYFRSLVTGTLKRCWCPVLYVVALSHLNTFIFSQDAAAQEVEAARRSMLRKIHYLTDEVLRSHLLLFRLPQQRSELGFDTYEQLPPIRAKRLESVLGARDSSDGKGD